MTAPQKFTKRPVSVEAWQFVQYPNGNTNGEEIAAWCGGIYSKRSRIAGDIHWIEVPEDSAYLGDWVIMLDGNIGVSDNDDFAAEFEAAS